jgi:hypothetical protein
MGTWELTKGYFEFGRRDIKDKRGYLAFQILIVMGLIPIGNIFMLGLLSYTAYQEYHERKTTIKQIEELK